PPSGRCNQELCSVKSRAKQTRSQVRIGDMEEPGRDTLPQWGPDRRCCPVQNEGGRVNARPARFENAKPSGSVFVDVILDIDNVVAIAGIFYDPFINGRREKRGGQFLNPT